jgi:hypothetical protein
MPSRESIDRFRALPDPGEATIVDCFRAGRRRLNADLVAAVGSALHPDAG